MTTVNRVDDRLIRDSDIASKIFYDKQSVTNRRKIRALLLFFDTY